MQAAAAELDVLLYGGGSHPFARWEDQEVSDGHRYATLIDRTQRWGRQMVIFGVHVHVGIRSAAKVWPLINALLTYHPHLTALSASLPYRSGTDTGLREQPHMLFQQLPRAGLPFQFETWAQYRTYLDDVFTTGVIHRRRHRAALGHPAVTVAGNPSRCAPATASPARRTSSPWPPSSTAWWSTSSTSSTRESRPRPLPPWHVQENKWRAARYGLDAIIIRDADNTEVHVVDDIKRAAGAARADRARPGLHPRARRHR